jgi:hypothetical protein
MVISAGKLLEQNPIDTDGTRRILENRISSVMSYHRSGNVKISFYPFCECRLLLN